MYILILSISMMHWLGTIPLHSFSKNKAIGNKDSSTVEKSEEAEQNKTELADTTSTESSTYKNV